MIMIATHIARAEVIW